ncbi:hypothetical protein GGI35DRAFT_485191 [Trichoderma velutinum]
MVFIGSNGSWDLETLATGVSVPRPETRWFLIGIGAIGMLQNVYAAGSSRKPSASGFNYDKFSRCLTIVGKRWKYTDDLDAEVNEDEDLRDLEDLDKWASQKQEEKAPQQSFVQQQTVEVPMPRWLNSTSKDDGIPDWIEPIKPGTGEETLKELFETVLDVLADTDVFNRPDCPSTFIVYAHDNPGEVNASANAVVVRSLIRWLLAVRTRTVSDKSPLRLSREGGIAVAMNILSNQLCLLPRHERFGVDGEITSIEKVILCSSEDIHSEIRGIVEGQRGKEGFHHVFTELAFLALRRSRLGVEHGVVPIALGGDSMEYLPFPDGLNVFLKIDSSQGLTSQYKLFFSLLRLLYADEHTYKLIDIFGNCFNEARGRLREQSSLTRRVFREIAYNEIFKAQDRVLRSLAATIRDEPWMKEWTSRTKTELSQREAVISYLLKLYNVVGAHEENLQQRQDQTGSWILEDEKYRRWKDWKQENSPDLAQQDVRSHLWCYGKLGIAYVVCKYARKQTASSLMLDLVTQLAQQRHRLSSKLISNVDKDKDRTPKVFPYDIECQQILQAEVRQFKQAFFIIDALTNYSNLIVSWLSTSNHELSRFQQLSMVI